MEFMTLIDKKFKARYISDVPDEYLKKGQIYEVWVSDMPTIWGYIDNHGESYGVPADRFERVE